jgi:hypothetical protein
VPRVRAAAYVILVVIALAPAAASAKALASASIEITSFVWYVDLGTPGFDPANPTEDVVLTARYQTTSGSSDVILVEGGGLVFPDAQLGASSGSDLDDYGIRPTGGIEDIEAGVICQGSACGTPSSPPGFGALEPPPTSQYAQGYGAAAGYFASLTGPAPDDFAGIVGGVRSDASLTSADSTAGAGNPDAFLPTGSWNSSTDFVPTADLSTYFAVTFSAQALAYGSTPGDSAEAAVSLRLAFDPPGDNPDGSSNELIWEPLNLVVDSDDVDYNQMVQHLDQPLYSYDSPDFDFFDLLATQRYTVTVDVQTEVAAATGPSQAPSPSALWLMLIGGLPLAAGRLRAQRKVA